MTVDAQAWWQGLVTGARYVPMALSFLLVHRFTRSFDLSPGAGYILAAYIAWFVAIHTNISLFTAGALAIAGAAAVAWPIQTLLDRVETVGAGRPSTRFLASLAVLVAMEAVIGLSAGDATIAVFRERDILAIGAARVTDEQVLLVATAWLLTAVLGIGHRHLRAGRLVRAVGIDPDLARLFGLPAGAVRFWSLTGAFALAGLSGTFAVVESGVYPGVGLNVMLKAVVASMLGGLHGPALVASGALLLGVMEQFVGYAFGGLWMDVASYIAFLGLLLLRPEGLLRPALRPD